MRKLTTLSLIAVLTIGCSAQKKVETSHNNVPTLDSGLTKYMNTITAGELKTHLYIVASDKMEGRDTGTEGQKEAGRYLISQYKKDNIPFPMGADNYYQKVPAAFMNTHRGEHLNDSENIIAFIEGSEKPEEVLVISAHYDHVGVKKGKVFNG